MRKFGRNYRAFSCFICCAEWPTKFLPKFFQIYHSMSCCWRFKGAPRKYQQLFQTQKNPRAHKNKIGTPPPCPPKPKIPPPPKTRNFMDMGFSCRTDAFFPGVHKIWRSHFRPQNCGQKFYGHKDFSLLVWRASADKQREKPRRTFSIDPTL